jgi:death-on-curing protein
LKYISAEELVVINRVVVNESGGSIGLRDPGLLESVAFKPQTSFGDQELYVDIYLKAAVLFEAIVNYHVFVDGNKRTAYASLARFLQINGFELIASSDNEIVEYTVEVATQNPEIIEVAAWIKEHYKKHGK